MAPPKARSSIKVAYAPPKMYYKQQKAIFAPTRSSWIEATTKSGKTTGCAIWLWEMALYYGKPGWNGWWVAPTFQQADIAFRRMLSWLDEDLVIVNKTRRTIILPNGAMLWFLSAQRPDDLYGEDVFAAVLDEASRMREEAWFAVRSTLTATKGWFRVIGNVKGRKNWFFRECRKAEHGERDREYHKLTCMDAVEGGVLDPEEIKAAERDLPPDVFRELYWAEATENTGNPFDGYEACLVDSLSNHKPICWGWDVSKSYTWTVGVGLDGDRAVAQIERFQRPWGETMQAILECTDRKKALVDSTGVGDPVVEALQRGRILNEDLASTVEGRKLLKKAGMHIQGFKFTGSSRQLLLEHLRMAISNKRVSFPRESVLHSEIDQFEYGFTLTSGVRYQVPEGFYDDSVMALALAVWHMDKSGGTIRHRTSVKPPTKREYI